MHRLPFQTEFPSSLDPHIRLAIVIKTSRAEGPLANEQFLRKLVRLRVVFCINEPITVDSSRIRPSSSSF